jgi:hypothetical protein
MFSEMLGFKKNSHMTKFKNQFAIIKQSVEAMINTLNLFESRITVPSHYWSTDSIGWKIGADLFEKDDEWLFNNYRFYINEIFSGCPYGDYSQYKDTSEADLLNLPFIKDYTLFTQDLPSKYHVQEPFFPADKQWGVKIGSRYLSSDSTRFQRYMANLYQFGVLSNLEEKANKNETVYIVEIGAGFGMLADYLLSSLPKNTKYIIIDIPSTLAMAATYLSLVKPNLKQAIFNPESSEGFVLSEELKKADIVFLPHYAANSLLDLPHINLAINTFSFQEMTEENIHYYADILSKKLNGYFYSDNFRRHPHNFALKSRVCDILKDYLFLFPNSEVGYDKIERGANYMWQAYTHLGTSKQRPVFLSLNNQKGENIWGDNYRVDLKTGAVYEGIR